MSDEAVKLVSLDTTDGRALLGYAGLGATAAGNTPANWISSVLRGRAWSLEQSLAALAEAMKREFPPHLARLAGIPAHHILIPSFVAKESRLYTIELQLAGDRKDTAFFRHTRWLSSDSPPRHPRIAVAGSGVHGLDLRHPHKWGRPLLRLLSAYERNRVGPLVVARALVALNGEVCRKMRDISVGPNCVVAMRHREGAQFDHGSQHWSFTGDQHDTSPPILPTIASGMDIQAITGVFMKEITRRLDAGVDDGALLQFDEEFINEALRKLPEEPDEKLR